jgi:hypothetical protein
VSKLVCALAHRTSPVGHHTECTKGCTEGLRRLARRASLVAIRTSYAERLFWGSLELADRTGPVPHRVVWHDQWSSASPTALLTRRWSGAHGISPVHLSEADAVRTALRERSLTGVWCATVSVLFTVRCDTENCCFAHSNPMAIWIVWTINTPQPIHWRHKSYT